jgi:WD40 repeat protein
MARNALTIGKGVYMKGHCRFSVGAGLLIFLILFLSNILNSAEYKLYVSHPGFYEDGKGVVSVINYNKSSKISSLYTMPGVDRVEYVKPQNRLYAFSSARKMVQVYDPVTDKMILEYETGGPVADVVFSLNGKLMYVANGSDSPDPENKVTIINTETGEQVFEIVAGKNPYALELSPDGTLLYIADRQTGTINVVELKTFQVLRSFYAGVSPTDIEMSWDGRELLISSDNINGKASAGAGIAVVDLRSENVRELVNTEANVIQLITAGPDKVVAVQTQGNQSGVFFYDFIKRDSEIVLSRAGQVYPGGKITDIAFYPGGNSILVSTTGGNVKTYDLISSQEKNSVSQLADDNLGGIAMVPVNFTAELAKRDSIINIDRTTDAARTAYFEKAYLYRSMADKNSEIKIYTDLAHEFANTETEVNSLLRLGDLCYEDLLYANSADFYAQAFSAYANLLENPGKDYDLDQNHLMSAIERLGEFSAENDKDYLKNIVAKLETLRISSPDLAELYFELAYYLKKQGDTKLARRCIDETERQMINISDKNAYKRLRDRIDLLESKGRVVLTANKIKRSPLIDGSSGDWEDKYSLFIDRRSDVLVNEQRWVDDRDLSIEFRAAYDEDNLYLLAIVADDSIYSSDDLRRDEFTLYIDPSANSGDFLNRKKSADKSLIKLDILPHVEEDAEFDINYTGNIHPVFAGRETGTGYCLEFKIPFVYLENMKPESKTRFGLGFEVKDADNDLVKDPPKIMGWVAPTESLTGDRDFRMLGILELK